MEAAVVGGADAVVAESSAAAADVAALPALQVVHLKPKP